MLELTSASMSRDLNFTTYLTDLWEQYALKGVKCWERLHRPQTLRLTRSSQTRLHLGNQTNSHSDSGEDCQVFNTWRAFYIWLRVQCKNKNKYVKQFRREERVVRCLLMLEIAVFVLFYVIEVFSGARDINKPPPGVHWVLNAKILGVPFQLAFKKNTTVQTWLDGLYFVRFPLTFATLTYQLHHHRKCYGTCATLGTWWLFFSVLFCCLMAGVILRYSWCSVLLATFLLNCCLWDSGIEGSII